jgi:hypothetical protein
MPSSPPGRSARSRTSSAPSPKSAGCSGRKDASAPDPGVARWQHRLTPIQKRFAGGCHLDRPIDRLVAGAGFRLDEIKTFSIRGPKIASWMYQGTAVPPV